MDIFKLIGTIAINAKDALSQIDQVSSKATAMAKTVEAKTGAVGRAFTNVGKTIAPVSDAAANILTSSVKGASDFQNGMAKVSTLVDTNAVDMKKMSDAFLKISDDTGRSATELAEAGYQALSASVPVDKLEDFMKVSTNLSKVGFTETSTAVDVLTTAMNAYGDKAGTADQIANKLVKTQNKGRTSVRELASSMGKVIPTASAMNVSIDNLMTSYVELTKQGIATAEATTYTNSMLNELGKSSTDVGKILKDRTGMSFSELMGSGKNLYDVLEILQTSSDEMGIGFNELWGSAEAGKAALMILNGGGQEWEETMEAMCDDQDVLSEGLEKLRTPAEMLNETINKLRNMGIRFGTVLLEMLVPALEDASDWVGKVSDWFSSLSDETKKSIGTFLILVAILAPVLMAIGTFFSTISGGIQFVRDLWGAIQGLWVLLGTNPVGWVILAIGLLIFTFISLRDEITGAVSEIWQSFQENVALWGEFFTAVGEGISTAWDTTWGAVTGVFTRMVTNVGRQKERFLRWIRQMKEKVSTYMENIKTAFTEKWEAAKTAATDAIEAIKEGISTGIEEAHTTVTTILGNIGQAFTDIFEGAKTTVENAINYIKGLFDFEWSLPRPKLPEIVKVGEKDWGFIKIPTFDIQWNRKAMDSPYLFTQPTLFDINPLTGTAKGAGEAGDEIMYGRNNLLNDIREASGGPADTSILENVLMRIFDLLAEYVPQLSRMQVVTDTGAIVGEMLPVIDEKLGELVTEKERWN